VRQQAASMRIPHSKEVHRTNRSSRYFCFVDADHRVNKVNFRPILVGRESPAVAHDSAVSGEEGKVDQTRQRKTANASGVTTTSTIFIFTLKGSKHGISPQQRGTWRRIEMDQHTQTETIQTVGFSINISSSLHIAA
jgi:hypothetical protein